jgi:AcrR family transcriptional regulator
MPSETAESRADQTSTGRQNVIVPATDTTAAAKPSTQDRILTAFEELLIDGGERSATLDAVAAAASVSKGGLLYHFGSKDALVEGMIARLAVLVGADVARITTAEAGPIDHLLRTSMATGGPLDHALIATARLAQAADPRARNALKASNDAWFAAVTAAIADDPALARTIMLISDGLAYSSAYATGGATEDLSQADVNGVVELVHELIAMRAAKR